MYYLCDELPIAKLNNFLKSINDRHYDITVGFQKLPIELCYSKVIEPRDSRDIDNFRNQHNQEDVH